MTVRLLTAPAAPTRTDAAPCTTGQYRAEEARHKAVVLALRRLCTKNEPVRDGNQNRG